MSAERPSPRHSAFFDLESNPERDRLTRPQSMLRSTEWGGLTVVSLLAGLAFPPYFVSVLALACLNAGGMLWVTHLNDAGRRRLREFEKEFAQGHALEERGDARAAVGFYEDLAPRYGDVPRIAGIALHRAEHLRLAHPEIFGAAGARGPAERGPVEGAPDGSKPARKRERESKGREALRGLLPRRKPA